MSKLPEPIYGEVHESQKANPLYSDGKLFKSCELKKELRNQQKFNVLLIEIESLTFNHFRRMFPLTFEYLKNDLENNHLFEKFMIIGENTKPNLFPLISGVIPSGIRELGISSEDWKYWTDYAYLPFIWKDFQKLGHTTMFNEDFLVNGRYHFFK